MRSLQRVLRTLKRAFLVANHPFQTVFYIVVLGFPALGVILVIAVQISKVYVGRLIVVPSRSGTFTHLVIRNDSL